MGFKRKRKVYKLDFTGTEYQGLEVRLTGLTTGEFLEFAALNANSEDANETEKLLQFFARHLISWNLEDENGPVPATLEGVKDNDLSMSVFIMEAWTAALTEVPAKTEKKSSDGELPLTELIPTESLSKSLTS